MRNLLVRPAFQQVLHDGQFPTREVECILCLFDGGFLPTAEFRKDDQDSGVLNPIGIRNAEPSEQNRPRISNDPTDLKLLPVLRVGSDFEGCDDIGTEFGDRGRQHRITSC